MSKAEIKKWKWKSTIIDFDNISNEKDKFNFVKKDWVFKYLGIPDKDIHEWYNGRFSCEYNDALIYAKELGLVEDYVDYEDKIYELQQELDKYKDAIAKFKDLKSLIGILNDKNMDYSFSEILKELEKEI
jgi:hypothetical protein